MPNELVFAALLEPFLLDGSMRVDRICGGQSRKSERFRRYESALP
jgi:hypothetical protein